jgi:hypothetical protein
VLPRLRTFIACAGAGFALSAAACGSSLARPPSAPQPRDGWQRVPYPAPPVHVQGLSPPPQKEGFVWVDGHWEWNVRAWEWQNGGWVRPVPNARYAKPAYARLADGTLVYAPGRWIINGKAKSTTENPADAGPSVPCPCDPPVDAAAVSASAPGASVPAASAP